MALCLHSTSHCRAEILGALASVLIIWALVGVLVYEAIRRLIVDVEYVSPFLVVFGDPDTADGTSWSTAGRRGKRWMAES